MTGATAKQKLRIVAAGAAALLLAALVVAWLTGWPPDGLDRETVARWPRREEAEYTRREPKWLAIT